VLVTPGDLHHIGFVVSDIETALPAFERSLGAVWDGQIWEDPIQRVKVAFLGTAPGQAQIELVAPVGDASPVFRFLERGGGMHHVCYEVGDLTAQIAEMRARGAILARPPKPAVAFAGRRIAWVLTAEKLLVELLER
jgi:methylmalonyl-CoA/ethylmalonyl-CoA epimerase